MEEGNPERLHSWKEIAAYLDVSVRTAQLWETQRGLPVHSLPGGQRRRPYALVSELEQWIEEGRRADEAGGSSHDHAGGSATATGRAVASHAMPIAAALVLLLVAAGSAAWWWPVDPPDPASWELRADTLVIQDAAGQELWRKEAPAPLRRSYYDPADPDARMPVLADIDGDGATEVLFILCFEERGRASLLTAYDSDGTELWTHRAGERIATPEESFDDIYVIGAVRPLPQPDGTQDLIVAAHHHLFYPSTTTRLSHDGTVKARYWHAGHVGIRPRRLLIHDLVGGPGEEILLAGVNNARDRATLIVLDPDRMSGAAAEQDPTYRLDGVGPAAEIARIFFPRSAVAPPSDRFAVAVSLHPGRDGVTVSVVQAPSRSLDEEVLYTFAPTLELLRVSPGDHFLGRFRQLLSEGTLTHTLDEELSALAQVQILRPTPDTAPPPTDGAN